VVIGVGLMADLAELVRERVDAHRFAIVSDDNVAALHVDALLDRFADAGLDATLLTFPAGEVSKTRKSWSILTDEMLDAGMGRDCCVVAVGGGVTTDLAGCVAATYMRGVSLVQVPTSYLAMIERRPCTDPRGCGAFSTSSSLRRCAVPNAMSRSTAPPGRCRSRVPMNATEVGNDSHACRMRAALLMHALAHPNKNRSSHASDSHAPHRCHSPRPAQSQQRHVDAGRCLSGGAGVPPQPASEVSIR
jgi:hypothetical protein